MRILPNFSHLCDVIRPTAFIFANMMNRKATHRCNRSGTLPPYPFPEYEEKHEQ